MITIKCGRPICEKRHFKASTHVFCKAAVVEKPVTLQKNPCGKVILSKVGGLYHSYNSWVLFRPSVFENYCG